MSAQPSWLSSKISPWFSAPKRLRLLRVLIGVALLATVWAAERYGFLGQIAPEPIPVDRQPEPGLPPPTELAASDKDRVEAKALAEAAPPATADPLVIDGLSLRNSSGRTIYRGQIDLAPTMERIAAGRRLRFPNDGTTFQNRENRLPRRPPGYYREWVVPTPKEPGPGPQRLITGEGGEVWYTSDHYRSFRRLPTEIRIR